MPQSPFEGIRSLASSLLESVDEVSIRLCDTRNGVDSAQNQLTERILVRDLNHNDNIRFSPAGVDGLNLLNIGKGARDCARLSRLHVDQYIGPIRHDNSTVDWCVDSTRYGGNHWSPVNVADTRCPCQCRRGCD